MLQEFLDARDADDARHYTNGKDLDGSRLIVEFARRVSNSYISVLCSRLQDHVSGLFDSRWSVPRLYCMSV